MELKNLFHPDNKPGISKSKMPAYVPSRLILENIKDYSKLT